MERRAQIDRPVLGGPFTRLRVTISDRGNLTLHDERRPRRAGNSRRVMGQWRRRAITFLFWLAISGLIASVVVHGAALFGVAVAEYLPQVWLLHLGIFVVVLPLIFLQPRLGNRAQTWETLKRQLPPQLHWATTALILYVLVNFAFNGYMLGNDQPEIRDGSPVIVRKGQVVRQISLVEYHALLARITRMFSGYWLYFYSVAALAYRALHQIGDNEFSSTRSARGVSSAKAETAAGCHGLRSEG